MNALHEFNSPSLSPGAGGEGAGPQRADGAGRCEASLSAVIPPSVDILGFPVCVLDTDQLVETAIAHALARKPLTLSYVNAHVFNLALRNRCLADALRGADVLFADGISVVWASRWADARLPERMTANDYYPRFMSRCAEEGLRVFLLGGRLGVAEKAAAAMRAVEPTLRIVGTHHGQFSASSDHDVVARINAANVDVLLAGLSTPRQELFLAQHRDRFRVPVRWCVGAMLDYWAGLESPAPAWAARWGAEWLYRLAVDPVGKWRRYLLGNPRFVFNTLRWSLRARGAPQGEPRQCH